MLEYRLGCRNHLLTNEPIDFIPSLSVTLCKELHPLKHWFEISSGAELKTNDFNDNILIFFQKVIRDIVPSLAFYPLIINALIEVEIKV